MEFFNEDNMLRILIAVMTDIWAYGRRVECQRVRMGLNEAEHAYNRYD
jgi:hypothetical protein